MRRIKKSEIKETAWIMAENFNDYPLYDVFFDNDKKKTRRIFYFFWFRMYTRRKFSYVTEEKDLVISFKKPENENCSPIGLLINPKFLFGFIKNIPVSALKLVREFGKMEDYFMQKYYNPRTDSFAQAICAMKRSRGNGIALDAFNEFDDGRPVYCVTHKIENVKLYEHLGMELCDTADFYGVKHYVMKKRGAFII